MCVFGQIGLAAKPIFHRVSELINWDVCPNFQEPISDGQGIVKNRGVCEIAHAEIVEPLQRTRLKRALLLEFNADLAGEHAPI